MDAVITCPGCRRPLHAPADAAGKPAHCPHCRAAFRLSANPDGTPGRPVPVRPGLRIPRLLVVPAFGLIILGSAGVIVNGAAAARCEADPGYALEYARRTVREEREIESAAAKPADRWAFDPQAAVAGAAVADVVRDLLDDELAAARAGTVRPVMWRFAGVSLMALAGGVAILIGRFYPLALLGCLAAAVNVNHNCFIPGLAVGVWGVLALVRDEARAHFKL